MKITTFRADTSDDTVEEDQTEDMIVSSQTWEPGEVTFFGPASRCVSVCGEISSESMLGLISQLLELDSQGDDPIILYLDTPGGSATAGMVAYDTIRTIKSPVVAVVTGNCMSAGLLLLSACDYRIAAQHSMFFYHQVVVEDMSFISETSFQNSHALYQHFQATYDEIVRERIKYSKKAWAKSFAGQTEKYMTSQQALDVNLIDRIQTYAKKPKIIVDTDE